ncbi:MAG: hypothetical protein U0441_09440 [Polyangiaceae bacterium]
MLFLVVLTLSGIGLMVFLGGQIEQKRREHLRAHARRLGLVEDPLASERGFVYLAKGIWNGAQLALGVRAARTISGATAAAPQVIEIAAVGRALPGAVHFVPRERREQAIQEGHAVAALSGDADFDAKIVALTPQPIPADQRSNAFAPAPSAATIPWLTEQVRETLLGLKSWRHLDVHGDDHRIVLSAFAREEDIDRALLAIQLLAAGPQSSGPQGPFR